MMAIHSSSKILNKVPNHALGITQLVVQSSVNQVSEKMKVTQFRFLRQLAALFLIIFENGGRIGFLLPFVHLSCCCLSMGEASVIKSVKKGQDLHHTLTSPTSTTTTTGLKVENRFDPDEELELLGGKEGSKGNRSSIKEIGILSFHSPPELNSSIVEAVEDSHDIKDDDGDDDNVSVKLNRNVSGSRSYYYVELDSNGGASSSISSNSRITEARKLHFGSDPTLLQPNDIQIKVVEAPTIDSADDFELAFASDYEYNKGRGQSVASKNDEREVDYLLLLPQNEPESTIVRKPSSEKFRGSAASKPTTLTLILEEEKDEQIMHFSPPSSPLISTNSSFLVSSSPSKDDTSLKTNNLVSNSSSESQTEKFISSSTNLMAKVDGDDDDDDEREKVFNSTKTNPSSSPFTRSVLTTNPTVSSPIKLKEEEVNSIENEKMTLNKLDEDEEKKSKPLLSLLSLFNFRDQGNMTRGELTTAKVTTTTTTAPINFNYSNLHQLQYHLPHFPSKGITAVQEQLTHDDNKDSSDEGKKENDDEMRMKQIVNSHHNHRHPSVGLLQRRATSLTTAVGFVLVSLLTLAVAFLVNTSHTSHLRLQPPVLHSQFHNSRFQRENERFHRLGIDYHRQQNHRLSHLDILPSFDFPNQLERRLEHSRRRHLTFANEQNLQQPPAWFQRISKRHSS